MLSANLTSRVANRNRLRPLALLPAMLLIFTCSGVGAQSAPDDWEKAAGGKMSFDVASVRQNRPGPPQWQGGKNLPASNIPLTSADDYPSIGGFFSATNTPLSDYIAFAYKLTFNQARVLLSELPKWAAQDRFDIEARAQGNPTKDQMRLMVQSLLEERFELMAHFETKQIPVYELVFVKPNTFGSQLRPHSDDPPCPANGSSGSQDASGTVAGGFPIHCGAYMPMQPTAPGRQRMGARNLPWQIFANTVGLMGRVAGRPVVDHTGVSGTVDFVLEWTPGAPATPDFQPDLSGPTFPEALQDQLGLKLNSEVAPIQILIIDHVEEPSAN